MKTKYKIYEDLTLQEAMNKLLDDGADPLCFDSLEEAWNWKTNSPDRLLNIPFACFAGKVRRLTPAECKNLASVYERYIEGQGKRRN